VRKLKSALIPIIWTTVIMGTDSCRADLEQWRLHVIDDFSSHLLFFLQRAGFGFSGRLSVRHPTFFEPRLAMFLTGASLS
jgi:hypothetical protein